MRGMSVIITMSLIILLSLACSPVTADIYINTPDATADFYGTPTSGTAPLTVTFIGTAYGGSKPVWDFGDGGSSNQGAKVTHTYTRPGTYTVFWTVYLPGITGGQTTTGKWNYITVNPPVIAPVAAFTGSPTSGTAPQTVQFTDISTNTPTGWSWNFGDGITSTLQNPSHTYASAGTYTVILTATNSAGSNVCTKMNYITYAPAVVATPTPTPTTVPTTLPTTSLTTAPTPDYDARIAALETQLAGQNQKLEEHGNTLEKITNFLRIFFGWK